MHDHHYFLAIDLVLFCVFVTGVLCGTCGEGFSTKRKDGQLTCDACKVHERTSQGLLWAVLILPGVVIGVFVATYKLAGRTANTNVDQYKKFGKHQTTLKIVLGLGQVLALVGASLQITIPAPFRDVSKFLSLLNLDLFGIVNLQCLYPYTFVGEFVARTCFPVCLLLVIKIVALCKARWVKDDVGLRKMCASSSATANASGWVWGAGGTNRENDDTFVLSFCLQTHKPVPRLSRVPSSRLSGTGYDSGAAGSRSTFE